MAKLGGIEAIKQECRDALGRQLLEALVQDVRFGLRMLRKSPGFAAIAVGALALGIGANTAIFSLIDGVLLGSLPVHDPSQLVVLQWRAHESPHMNGSTEYSSFGDCGESGISGPSGCSFPLPFFEQIHTRTDVFADLTAFAGPAALDLSGNGPASRVRAEIVSGDYFSTLGVSAAIGRTLGPSDDTPSAAPAVVLSYAYWQSAFGGKRSVLARTILLNRTVFTVVGVAERSFTSLSPGKTQDLWLPIAMVPRLGIDWGSRIHSLGNWWLVILARLKSDVPLGEAQTATNLEFRSQVLHGPTPVFKAADNPELFLAPAQDALVGRRGQLSTLLYLLLVAVGIILLITCANVAGLLLSRGTTRQKEMAVRLGLGAGPGAILRQLLTEGVLLSLSGGLLGIVFAYWGVHAITALIIGDSGDRFPYMIAPDWRILAFTLGVCVLAGILFGLAPALQSTRVDLVHALKENASTFPGGGVRAGRFHLGSALVVAQVALSVLVLVGAGLLVRTLENLRGIAPGFDTHNVLLFEINPGRLGYKEAQSEQLFNEIRERLAALPGVTSVSDSSQALLTGGRWSQTVRIEGQARELGSRVDVLAAGPGFFKTMRIAALEGRMFTAADYEQAGRTGASANNARVATVPPKVSGASGPLHQAFISVLVNERFVRRYFPNQSPLGKRITEGGSSATTGEAWAGYLSSRNWLIVGVVADTKYDTLRRGIEPVIYLPFAGGYGGYFELRTAADPRTLIPTVRDVVNKINKDLPLSDVSTQTEQINELTSRERLIARVSGFFGVVALALACIGLYGLLSYEVTRRTREIGIYVALGAQPSRVLRTVVKQGVGLAAAGVAVGLGLALGLTRYLESMLYGVTPMDPVTFGVVAWLLLTVALAACFVPARRAMRVDPVVALRQE
ncbi:MAG: ABC transporter permease [Acidobacteriota bacterium]|nr:ABC transporter permease [Acidobacteriota bacterium]